MKHSVIQSQKKKKSTVMSSDTAFIASLNLARTNLYKFGGPICIILGTVSSLFSLAVFTRKNLRKNPCSTYYIAYNIASFLAIYTVVLPETLSNGYNINATLYNVPLCRLRLYALLLAGAIGPTYLILASVDRVLVTSRNALTRKRSTFRMAYKSISSVTVFFLLAESHTLVLGRITVLQPGVMTCYFQLDGYYIFISYYSVLVTLLIPSLMLIFGLWTIKNVRGFSHVAPASNTAGGRTGNANVRGTSSKDRQLLRILLLDISVHLIFTVMISTVLTYQQIIPDYRDSAANTQFRIFLVIVSGFINFIPPCIGFYNNLLVSKTFRSEAKNVLMGK